MLIQLMSSEENLAQASTSSTSWNSWFQKAKSITINALDFVKNDLEEFSAAVTDQTTGAVNSIKNHVPKMETVKRIMNSVNDFLNVEEEINKCDNNEKLNIPKVQCPNGLKKSWSRLFAIQADPCTYGDEPRGVPELFEDWLDHFNLKDKKDEINDLLRYNPLVRQFYADLVPCRLSNGLFWQRYFYKVHQFKLDESQRKSLKKFNKNKPVLQKSDYSEFDFEALNISSIRSISKPNLYSKSKSTLDLSNIINSSTTPKMNFFRRHKSPSLDIEIKEAELIAQGLLPRRDSCSSLDNISWNGPVFDSTEEHSNFCENLCQTHGELIEWA